LGTIFDEKRLIKIVTSKRFRFLRLKEKDIKKANSWFTKHGPKTVLFGRFIPVIRSLISIPAGMNRMNMKSFLTLTIIGSTIWNTVLVLIGRKVGHEWPKIVAAMDKFSHLVLGIIIVLIVIVIVVFYTVRIRKEKLND
jgi:membrane protein DedA with SNARE-associated domain